MNEDNPGTTNNFDEPDLDEELAQAALDELKKRATTYGIQFHLSIGIDKLQAKISEYMRIEEAKNQQAAVDQEALGRTAQSMVQNATAQAKADALKLVRLRVTCMDPSKKEYDGEIFSAGNAVIPTVKKYVAFGVPWFVPNIIYQMMKDKHYQAFVTRTVQGGGKVKEGRQNKTYAIEVLPDLTDAEFQELKQRQLMASGKAA